MIKKDWFRVKKYPHIGLPIRVPDRKWVEPYVKNPIAISKHGFYPFLHKTLAVRKFRREISENGIRSKQRVVANKSREIFYANHLDSNIYSYYSHLLIKEYELRLIEKGLQDCVIAYRKIPLNHNPKSRNKCNVDFANDVFQFISNSKENELVVVALDISSFFDTLDHGLLKKAWINLLGGEILANDHYNLFRNITNFSFVEEKHLFNEFKNSIIVETKSRIIKERKIVKSKYLKNKGAIAYCKLEDFDQRIRKKNIIQNNKLNDSGSRRRKGIPQGSPISSTLANIYLLEFDNFINKEITSKGGIYRRYSDDMIIVCKREYEKEMISKIRAEIISDRNKLEVQEKKTQVFIFKKENGRFRCYQKHVELLRDNKKFEYLGFEFDGKYTLIRSASVSSFYRKLKRSLRRAQFYSRYTKNKQTRGKLFKSRLYKRFSYLGAERRRKYARDKFNITKWNKTLKYDWGNFLSYAFLAADVIPENKIRKQLRRHWDILNGLMN